MRRLTVLVDMDDTIENLLSAWVDTLNEEHETNVKPDDIRHWDLSMAFPTVEWKDVYAPLKRDDFWMRVKPIDGAADALKRLIEDGHKVFIVTASAYETLKSKMDCVLFRYFPFLDWNDVIVTSHKQMVKGDVLIDDGVHNLKDGDYEKILMDAPHNRGYNAKRHGMTRVKNWEEAYQKVCEISVQS